MEHEYLIIKKRGEDLVVKGLKDNAPSDVVIPDGVTKIEYPAFRDCERLTSINIPDSVTDIDIGAFRGCSSLTSIVIPNSVTEIKESVFNGCSSLEHIILPKYLQSIDGSAFNNCPKLDIVRHPIYYKNGQRLSYVPKDVTEFKISNNVTEIGDFAFANCTCLTSIIIPNSVTLISRWAFARCTRLSFVDIPDSVTEIGWHAFHNCTSLKSISMPNSLIQIGKFAFWGCTSLGEIAKRDVGNNEATDEPVNYYKGKSITPQELLRELMSFIRKKNSEDKNNYNYSAELICISGKVSELSDMMKNRNDGFFEFWQGSEDLETNERFFHEFWRDKKNSRGDTDAFLVIENADLVYKCYMEDDEREFTQSLLGMMHSMKSINGMSSNMYKSGWHVILLMDDSGDKSWYNSDFYEYFSQKGLYKGYHIEG